MSVEGFKEQDSSFATRAIHDGQDPEQWESMAVVPPISLSTTFKQHGPAQFKVCGQLSFYVHKVNFVFVSPLNMDVVEILLETLWKQC